MPHPLTRLRALLLVSFLLPLPYVRAELSFQHSEDFESFKNGKSFEGETLPEAGTPPLWTLQSGKEQNIVSAKEGILTFRNASALYWTLKDWKERETTTSGFTVEFRAKIFPGGSFSMAASNGVGEVLIVKENAIYWGTKMITKDQPNTDRFHTYRLARWPNGGGYDLWRDGELIAEGEKGSADLGSRLWFGTWNQEADGAEVDYVRWDTRGAYCP